MFCHWTGAGRFHSLTKAGALKLRNVVLVAPEKSAVGTEDILSLVDSSRLPHRSVSHVHLRLAGMAAEVKIEPQQKVTGAVNYFRGQDRGQWLAGVPAFGQVQYRGVY